jgi:hypothetical protein
MSSFAPVLRKFSQPNQMHSASPHAGGSASDDSNNPPQRRQASEPMPTRPPKPRFWRTKRSSTPHRSNPSQPVSTPLTPKTENPIAEDGVVAIPSPVPLPTNPGVFATNPDVASLPEMIPAVSTVQVGLADTWNAIKEVPNVEKASEGPDTVGVSSIP